jgi:WD40 repeat protein
MFSDHTNTVTTLGFSRDGNYLVSGSLDNNLILYNYKTLTKLFVYSGHTSSVRYLLISKDSTTLYSAGDDKIIIIWELTTGNMKY